MNKQELYLDTHVVVWLYLGNNEKFSKVARQAINNAAELLISPMVQLELSLLHEVSKIQVSEKEILHSLNNEIDLKCCDMAFSHVIFQANQIKWTRDPFDRIITAQAAVNNHLLLTKDRHILSNYEHAIW